ncbi:MAG: glycosyltransferase [Elainellaceae cyanobacterium]
MRLSIITVCKNAEEHIEKALQSVACQSYPNIEYIIIDGNSQDQTRKIIGNYRSTISHFVSEADTGIYAAMNKGLALASGDYVYFLNADDYLVDNNVVAAIATFLQSQPDVDVLYGSLEVRNPSGDTHIAVPPPPENIADYMIYYSMPHQATFFRLSLFKKWGYFDESYLIAGDVELYLRLLQDESLCWCRYPQVVGSYFNGGRSLANIQATRQEFWTAQNQAVFYQSDDWKQRRICHFQKTILDLEKRVSEYQKQTAHLQSTIQEMGDHEQAELRLQAELQEAREKIKRLRNRLKQTETTLEETRGQVVAMETSKFWKLRSSWFQIKRLLGMHHED